jgi:hypothetical protein
MKADADRVLNMVFRQQPINSFPRPQIPVPFLEVINEDNSISIVPTSFSTPTVSKPTTWRRASTILFLPVGLSNA